MVEQYLPVLTFFLLLAVAGCSSSASTTATEPAPPDESVEPLAHPAAEDLAVRWGVDTHRPEGRFRSTLTLINDGDVPLGDTGWTLYFNFTRSIVPESVPPGVQFTNVNSQFWKLTPTEQFAPLSPGEERAIPFEAEGALIKEVSAPAGFYVVFEGDAGSEPPAEVGSVTVEPFTEEALAGSGQSSDVPTPESRYRANAQLAAPEDEPVQPITPTPVSVEQQAGTVTLDESLSIQYEEGLEQEAAYLAAALEPLLGARPAVTAGASGGTDAVVLQRGDVSVADARNPDSDAAYALTVDVEEGIQITGASPKGVFYGIQSLRALIPPAAHERAPGSVTLDVVTVRDAPRFGYRGMHLDVSRNFQSKAAVKKLLDLMAFYKLNTFHFHLTDDEGWRLPIEGLPELTDVGGRRGHPAGLESGERREHLLPLFGSGPDPDTSASYGSGFYSRSDFKEILRYAHERHITVIPEIDMPGHARAAIVAMESRYDRLMEAGRPEAARRYRLEDPDDQSEYRSIQGWTNNVVNVCQPSTYRFLEAVIDDIQEMYDEADAPLHTVHMGGDEVPEGAWEGSPVCQQLIQQSDSLSSASQLHQYFFKRMYRILEERSLTMAGWHEVAMEEAHHGDGTTAGVPNPYFADRRVRAYVWNTVGGGTSNAYRLANAGYEVVMAQASHLYLDMAYNEHPEEAGLYWAGFVDTRKPFTFAPFNLYAMDGGDDTGELEPLTEEGRANILGLQGQLWGETLVGPERLEYMVAPKILSLAERAWAAQPDWATIEDSSEDSVERERRLNADWSAFARRLGERELPRLDYLAGGIAYRLPPPGAVLEDGLLEANTAYPGLTIRYTTDGTTPTPQSPRYTTPVRLEGGPVKLRTFSTRGRGSRVVTVRGE